MENAPKKQKIYESSGLTLEKKIQKDQKMYQGWGFSERVSFIMSCGKNGCSEMAADEIEQELQENRLALEAIEQRRQETILEMEEAAAAAQEEKAQEPIDPSVFDSPQQ